MFSGVLSLLLPQGLLPSKGRAAAFLKEKRDLGVIPAPQHLGRGYEALGGFLCWERFGHHLQQTRARQSHVSKASNRATNPAPGLRAEATTDLEPGRCQPRFQGSTSPVPVSQRRSLGSGRC